MWSTGPLDIPGPWARVCLSIVWKKGNKLIPFSPFGLSLEHVYNSGYVSNGGRAKRWDSNLCSSHPHTRGSDNSDRRQDENGEVFDTKVRQHAVLQPCDPTESEHMHRVHGVVSKMGPIGDQLGMVLLAPYVPWSQQPRCASWIWLPE